MRCTLVGRMHHLPNYPLVPDDAVRLQRNPSNAHDPNALQVWVRLDGAWAHAGYVDARSAQRLAGCEVKAARLVTQGDGYQVPMEVEPVQ